MKRIVIIGAGSRGLGYAKLIKEYAKKETVVGVVEPNAERVKNVRELFPEITEDMIFNSWESFVSIPREVDAVVIATQDKMHAGPAIACADRGYHILLEKPMAPTFEECQQIVEAAKRNNIIFAVCHVLRYTEFFRKLKSIVTDERFGDIMTIQHTENVGYWHGAHSYVRGAWSNEAESSFMLLAKSCHDVDIIRFLAGVPCEKVQSFGSLLHFRKENKPEKAGSAKRCLDCTFEKKCSYSARKIYIRDRFNKGVTGWPVKVLADEINEDSIAEALRNGPYGKCVYECDNDVVDHQFVNFKFAGGISANFKMSVFNMGGREITIEGNNQTVHGDMATNKITISQFRNDKIFNKEVEPFVDDSHGGGDDGLIIEWLEALRNNDPEKIITGPDESLESHFITFLAEKSRLDGTVEALSHFL